MRRRFHNRPPTRPVTLAIIEVALLASLVFTAHSLKAAEPVSYNKDVRAILSDNCFACHGPDQETREADLRLDLPSNGSPTNAGSMDRKVGHDVIERIFTTDPHLRMPPASANKPLSKRDQQTLQRWIQHGGKYQRHWAFEPINKPQPPAVSQDKWCQTPIDHFILNKLQQRGLSPAERADRITLIRRLSLDLIGLLPTPDQVDAFAADDSPKAYDQLIDSLLASDHYGERWGRHWLDQARYADSNGYTFDNPRTMWPYRDWVINAINQDMPFDQFTVEQLAGDLLPDATIEQQIATGFHRNTLINEEGGTDAEQFRVESVIDRTNTTGEVWLGLTVGCAQCHNHKFDPISQQDYYGLYAFFNSTEDRNNRGPEVTASNPGQQRISEIDRELARLAQEAKLAKQTAGKENETLKWSVIDPIRQKADSGADFKRLDDQSLLVSGANAVEESYHVTYQIPASKIAALRLETLEHDSLPSYGPGRAGNGNFVLADVVLRAADGTEIPLNSFAVAEHSQSGHHISRAVDNDPHTGWAINGSQGNIARWAHFTLETPYQAERATELSLTLRFWQGSSPYNLGRFRLLTAATVPANANLTNHKIEALKQEKKSLESKRVRAMVMRELAKPRPTHLLIRGDFLRPGDPVAPTLPQHLLSSTAQESKNRLDLAKWIVDPNNPLTARVFVNRVWQQYFGKGLVETVEDFGSQGTAPTHPELLDWLAAEFIESGWSMKSLHRMIVRSAVYQQASSDRHEVNEVDPLNHLLGRQNRLRVDAEIVRDLSLSAAGRLTRTIGGPSVHPPQPAGVYAFTQKKKSWPTSTGPDRYRRTMYTFFYRSSPHPLLSVFDTPRFNVTCTRRSRSNTPLQSLMVANDPGLYEMHEALADRVIKEKTDTTARIKHAFQLCLCRHPSDDEVDFLTHFLNEQEAQFKAASESDPERMAWIALSRVLMNLDEFITRE